MLHSLFFWLFDVPLGSLAVVFWSRFAYVFFIVEPRRQRRLDALMAMYGLTLIEDTSDTSRHITFKDYGTIEWCPVGSIGYRNRALDMPYRLSRRRQFSYLVCLHEIGHWALGHYSRTEEEHNADILEIEAQAWQWAFTNAGEPITRKSRQRAWDKALITYELSSPDASRGALYREIVRYMIRPALQERLSARLVVGDAQALTIARRAISQ